MAQTNLMLRLLNVSRCLNGRYSSIGSAFSTTLNYSTAAKEAVIEPSKPKAKEDVRKRTINIQHLMTKKDVRFYKQSRTTDKNVTKGGDRKSGNVSKERQLNDEEKRVLKDEVDAIMSSSELSSTVKTASLSLQKCNKDVYKNEIVTKSLLRARLLKSERNLVDIEMNEDFFSLMEYLEKNVRSFETGKLISCLRSILTLFPSGRDAKKVLSSVEEEISLRMRYMNVDLLVQVHQILQIQRKNKEVLIKKCGEQLRRRVPRNPHELMLLMNYFSVDTGSRRFLELEDHVFDMISKLTVDNYCEIINYLAVYGSRNKSLIQLVLFYMNKTYEPRTIEQISSLLFSFGKLAIFDSELCKKLSDNLLAIKPTSLKKTSMILKSMSILGWRSDEAISHLLDSIVDEKIELDNSALESTLMSLASLNYCPRPKLEILTSKCTQVNRDEVSPLLWLNMVWSMAVLQEGSQQLLSSVLEPSFINKLKENGYEEWQYQFKLVCVNSAAQFDLNNYDGPLLHEDMLSCTSQDQAGKSAIVDDVLHQLGIVSGNEKFCRSHVVTKYGYSIDAELLVDQSGSIVEFSENQDADQCSRVAVRVQGFRDLTFPENLPKGPEALIVRHLGCQGYKVLTVPHYEWSGLKTDEKKLNYIRNKISTIVM